MRGLLYLLFLPMPSPDPGAGSMIENPHGGGSGMEIRFVDDSAGLDDARSVLERSDRIALDCEAAGYHRYSDRLCLVQVTAGARTFLLDPLAVDPEEVLTDVLEDPEIEVQMHGADFDVRLLDRDLGLSVRGLFDTQIAASLLGSESLGLSSLVEERLGVRLSKKYQKADWAQRPLPEPMRMYAAHDTAHLPGLAAGLKDDLERVGRMAWAKEEFAELERVRFDESRDEDPVARVKAARKMEPRGVARLREALVWRDEIGRDLDRALFRVAGDPALVEAAATNPKTAAELESVKGLNVRLVQEQGDALLDRFRRVDALPDDKVSGFPAATDNGRRGAGRPTTPEAEERFQRLKGIRNEQARALGIDRGVLLPNAVLQRIAEDPPSTKEDLDRVEGIRHWQVDVLAERLLDVL